MSLLAVFLVGSLACLSGLSLAIAFARAVLYANVLTELDGTHRSLRAFHAVGRGSARAARVVPLPAERPPRQRAPDLAPLGR